MRVGTVGGGGVLAASGGRHDGTVIGFLSRSGARPKAFETTMSMAALSTHLFANAEMAAGDSLVTSAGFAAG
jgi:hypothetical protein